MGITHKAVLNLRENIRHRLSTEDYTCRIPRPEDVCEPFFAIRERERLIMRTLYPGFPLWKPRMRYKLRTVCVGIGPTRWVWK